MHKKMFGLSLAAMLSATAFAVNAMPVLERFDPNTENNGTILSSGSVVPGEGLESGALKGTATGKFEAFYRHKMNTVAGKTYVLAFNYKTSARLNNYMTYVRLIFTPAPGSPRVKPIEKRLIATKHWRHERIEFTAPAGTAGVTVELMLDGRVPKGENVWIDFFRANEFKDGKAAGIDIENFETDFEIWTFDRHLIFDHFMFKDGGSVVTEWRRAKSGETFFQALGNNHPMQYSLAIENIKVSPRTNYAFSGLINSAAAYARHAASIIIFFYKDKNGKSLGESRLYPTSNKAGEWREISHSFTTPEKCEFIDIGLNMRRVSAKDPLLLDRIKFTRVADKAMLDFSIDPDKCTMTAKAILTGDLQKNKALKPEFVIQTPDKKEVKRIKSSSLIKDVDLKELQDGEYLLLGEFKLPDGKVMSTDVRKFGVYKNPSWHNDLGIQTPEMLPPAPWKALAFADNTVKTWQPQLKFGNNNLQLENVEADGKSLLLAPVSFVCDGKELLSLAKNVKWSVKPSLITGKGSASLEKCDVTVTAATDYLGFLRYTLTIKAKSNTQLKSGKLALKVKEAEFINHCDYSWTGVGSTVFFEQDKFTSRQLFSDLQIGSVDRGICVYLEEIYPAKRETAKDYLYADKSGRLEIEFINEPLTLTAGAEHKIEFAVCAYPFRPAEDLWRKLYFRAGKHSNFDLVWGISMPMMKHSGSTLAVADEAKVRAHLDAPRRPANYLMYQIPTYILNNIPEWTYFEKRWRNHAGSYYDMTKTHGGLLVAADYRDRAWQDLYCKIMDESLKKYTWDGIYYDCFSADWQIEQGRNFSPVFECRKFQERIYNTQRTSGRKNSLTVSHTGAAQISTLGMYSNVILMGEQYRAMLMNHGYYLDFMSLDKFRYENAVNVGPDRMFMPEYRKVEFINNPTLTVHTAMLTLLHNLMYYPHSVSWPVERRVRGRKIEFGLSDVKFLPYWKNDAAARVTADNPAIKLSVYEKPNGDMLVAVFNNSKKTEKFTLKVNGKVASAEYYDPMTDKSSVWNADTQYAIEKYLGAILTVKR